MHGLVAWGACVSNTDVYDGVAWRKRATRWKRKEQRYKEIKNKVGLDGRVACKVTQMLLPQVYKHEASTRLRLRKWTVWHCHSMLHHCSWFRSQCQVHNVVLLHTPFTLPNQHRYSMFLAEHNLHLLPLYIIVSLVHTRSLYRSLLSS